jgi:hypothetical protein
MRWFRLYSEIIHDPKVQLLSASTFREWINVLCVACENGGELPDDKDIAFTLRMTTAAARAMLLRLVDAKLLERSETGKLKPHNWDSRQFQSDVSTERVKRFREKKKAASGNIDETFQATESERPRACDTESDTEQKQKQIQKQSDLQRAEKSDETFAEFRKICAERAILGASDEDWMWAFHSWKHLDFQQKYEALDDLRSRSAVAVELASPALPQNYIRSKKWKRPQVQNSGPARSSYGDERLRNA